MLLKFSPKVEHLKMVCLTAKEGLNIERSMIQLLPGVNEVTEDEWQAMRDNISAELEKGEIVILAQKVSDGRGKPGGRKAKDLKQMPVNIAVKYVSECTNPETLLKWYKEITNEEVRLAITKKLQKMEIELPEDEIPEAPNASPMSVDELDEDDEQEDKTEENDEDGDEVEYDDDVANLQNMKLADLKKLAEENEIEGFESMKKDELIEALSK